MSENQIKKTQLINLLHQIQETCFGYIDNGDDRPLIEMIATEAVVHFESYVMNNVLTKITGAQTEVKVIPFKKKE